MRKHYIYKITICTTGLSYIGVSIDPFRRFKEHYKATTLIGKAMRKNGLKNCVFRVLGGYSYNVAYRNERKFIKTNRTLTPCGYNARRGGARKEDPYPEPKQSTCCIRLMIDDIRSAGLKHDQRLHSLGFDACIIGMIRSENPYPKTLFNDGVDWKSWDSGWCLGSETLESSMFAGVK